MAQARYGVRKEIKEAAEVFYKALSTRNVKLIDFIWAHEPYAAVAGPSGRIHQGWEQVCRYWENRFRAMADETVTVRLTGMVGHAVGDVGWFSGTERRTFTGPDGDRAEELRVTCVLERRGLQWQVVSYHASMPSTTLAEAS